MQKAVLVQQLERAEDGGHHRVQVLFRQGGAALQQLREGLALDVVHDDVAGAVGAQGAMHLDEVWVF